MGGPRAKNDEERKQRRLEVKRRSYRRSVVRKSQVALMLNRVELQEEYDAVHSQLSDMNKNIAISTREKSPEEVATIHPDISSPSTTARSPVSSTSYRSDSSGDESNSEYRPSDYTLSDTDDNISEVMLDDEAENHQLFPIQTTWNFDTVQDEQAFIKKLHGYHDECEKLVQRDADFLRMLLKSKEEELPGAWAAVETRKIVVCRVIRMESLFQQLEFRGWDKVLETMVDKLLVEYRRSLTLAQLHQRQVEFLKAALRSGELEHQCEAFKDWWNVALLGYV